MGGSGGQSFGCCCLGVWDRSGWEKRDEVGGVGGV